MAAPTGPRGSQAASPPGFEGFPFAVGGRPPEESAGKEQEQPGGVKKKPCRACTDFKSWMKVQKKQTTAAVQVTWGHGWLTVVFSEDLLDYYFYSLEALLEDGLWADILDIPECCSP